MVVIGQNKDIVLVDGKIYFADEKDREIYVESGTRDPKLYSIAWYDSYERCCEVLFEFATHKNMKSTSYKFPAK